jgi:RNA polymerase sigma-70 factor, ECF subfamily
MEAQDLLQRLKAGEAKAQEELVRAYQGRLKAAAGYFLGPQDPELEDVVQDTFVSAFRALSGFEGRSSLYTWLNHICVNHAFERIRQRKRRLARESEAWAAWLQQQPTKPQAEAHLDAQEEKARLQAGLAKLGKACAEVLFWRFQQGLTLNEIKERLKVPLGTVASRTQRCLQQLRQRVGQA